jgi:hypothetical protein
MPLYVKIQQSKGYADDFVVKTRRGGRVEHLQGVP